MTHVTVPDEDSFRVVDVTTSTTGPFAIEFTVFEKADLRVSVDDVELGQGDFTFVGNAGTEGGFDGGDVTLVTAISNASLKIWRDVRPVRADDISPGSPNQIQDINTALDRVTAHSQDNRRDLLRALLVPVGQSGAAAYSAADIAAVATALNDGTIANLLDNQVGAVASLAALSAYTATQAGQVMFAAGRTDADDGWEGMFRWVVGDKSAQVTADPQKAIWVAPTSDATGASGAWQRFLDGDSVRVRWWGAKGDDSSDDTTAVQAAVTYAHTNGFDLVWDDGTYLTTASITNLHDVRHIGPGKIKRGSVAFMVYPDASNTNYLYVSPSGTAGNDGLSSSEPMTIAAAFAAMENYEEPLQGNWRVECAAGTYTEGGTLKVISENRITIRGPDVTRGVPTAIFDGTSASLGLAFQFAERSFVYVKDIKIQNYNSATDYAILAIGYTDILCENVDIDDCNYGIGAREYARLRVRYGRIENCDYSGILAFNFALITIGYLASTVPSSAKPTTFLETDGTWLNGNGRGVISNENSQGHVDYCRIEDCVSSGAGTGAAIEMNYGTRLNVPACEINNNVIGVYGRGGSWLLDNGTTNYSGNTDKFIWEGFSGRVDSSFYDVPNLGHTAFLGRSVASVSAPATLASYQLHVDNVATLPANSLVDEKAVLKVKARGTMNKAAAASGRLVAFRLYIGAGFTIAASINSNNAVNGDFELMFEVFATGPNSQKTFVRFDGGDSRTGVYYHESFIGTSALDLTSDKEIDIYTYRDNASDVVDFEIVSAELYGSVS